MNGNRLRSWLGNQPVGSLILLVGITTATSLGGVTTALAPSDAHHDHLGFRSPAVQAAAMVDNHQTDHDKILGHCVAGSGEGTESLLEQANDAKEAAEAAHTELLTDRNNNRDVLLPAQIAERVSLQQQLRTLRNSAGGGDEQGILDEIEKQKVIRDTAQSELPGLLTAEQNAQEDFDEAVNVLNRTLPNQNHPENEVLLKELSNRVFIEHIALSNTRYEPVLTAMRERVDSALDSLENAVKWMLVSTPDGDRILNTFITGTSPLTTTLGTYQASSFVQRIRSLASVQAQQYVNRDLERGWAGYERWAPSSAMAFGFHRYNSWNDDLDTALQLISESDLSDSAVDLIMAGRATIAFRNDIVTDPEFGYDHFGSVLIYGPQWARERLQIPISWWAPEHLKKIQSRTSDVQSLLSNRYSRLGGSGINFDPLEVDTLGYQNSVNSVNRAYTNLLIAQMVLTKQEIDNNTYLNMPRALSAFSETRAERTLLLQTARDRRGDLTTASQAVESTTRTRDTAVDEIARLQASLTQLDPAIQQQMAELAEDLQDVEEEIDRLEGLIITQNSRLSTTRLERESARIAARDAQKAVDDLEENNRTDRDCS